VETNNRVHGPNRGYGYHTRNVAPTFLNNKKLQQGKWTQQRLRIPHQKCCTYLLEHQEATTGFMDPTGRILNQKFCTYLLEHQEATTRYIDPTEVKDTTPLGRLIANRKHSIATAWFIGIG
jgi:hypothetical protein